jgi:hypothetical protein
MNPDPDMGLTGSGLFSEVGSGSGPNRSGSATLPEGIDYPPEQLSEGIR